MAPDQTYKTVLEERFLLLIRRKGDPQKIIDHFESHMKDIQHCRGYFKNY